jgi:hypothetical protein
MRNDCVHVDGNFINGTPVGKHVIFTPTGTIHESVNYDAQGRLHGRCIFNHSDGTPFQVHNYEHGLLHGRQVVYFVGTQREKRVFNMRKGYVHGRFRMYDERGAEIENTLLKEDDGVTLQECLGKDALCAPSEPQADGSFANRWMQADGSIYNCPDLAAGNDCMCKDCYVPPALKEAKCACGWCDDEATRALCDEAERALRDQASVYSEDDRDEEYDSDQEREAWRDRQRESRWNY